MNKIKEFQENINQEEEKIKMNQPTKFDKNMIKLLSDLLV